MANRLAKLLLSVKDYQTYASADALFNGEVVSVDNSSKTNIYRFFDGEQGNLLVTIDYSKDKIQTSNISTLDEVVIAREKKLIQLKQDIHTTEALIRSLGERDYKIINDFYILERSQTKIGADLEITEDAVWKAKYVILKKLANLLSEVEVKTL